MRRIRFTILGHCQSKANHRMATKSGLFIKSPEARAFVKAVRDQMPFVNPPLEGPLAARIDIYYPSRRNDMDESAILDALQPTKTDPRCVYLNDRQVKQRLTTWHLDTENPRVEMSVWEKPRLDPPKPKKRKKSKNDIFA